MAKTSPTQRTLAWLRERGAQAAVVEKWIPQTMQRKDVWGFGDILVCDDLPGALLIQCTSGANMAARVTKIREECGEAARRWLAAGNRIQVVGWRKVSKERGSKLKVWRERVVDVTAADLGSPPSEW